LILHLVLFRLKPGVAGDDERFVRVMAAMEALPGLIADIKLWQHGRHLMPGGQPDPQAGDYGLLAGFENESALMNYFEHPAHGPVLAAWEEIADLTYGDLTGNL